MTIQIASRYRRSIALDHDWTAPSALCDYIVTPLVRASTERIIRDLRTAEGPRAWSLTGPYGTGKSSFALFLATVLSNRRITESTFGSIAADVRRFRTLEGAPLRQRFEPIFVTGERRSLLESTLRAIDVSTHELVAKNPSAQRLRRRVGRLSRQSANLVGSDVLGCIEELAALTLGSKRSGLFFVFDELGKFLEHSAVHQGADVFFLQQLAELAGRSSATVSVLTILHQSFAVYAQALSRSDQAEWQKIEGRFEELTFLEPADQLVALAGRAVDASRVHDPSLRKEHRERTERLMQLRDVPYAPHLAETLEDCFPIAPEVALLLGTFFRGGMAQNQRSLFAFLLSREPGGFQSFAERTFGENVARAHHRLYSVSDLFDYVANVLAIRKQSRRQERLWTLAEHSIAKQDERGHAENVRLLKAIAVLERFGPDAGLRASTGLLALALGETESQVTQQLAELRNVVVFRRHSDSYHFWDGSDVDLESLIKAAREHVGRNVSVADALSNHMSIRPIVAARHLHVTGTLRWLEPRFVDESQIAPDSRLEPSSQANGLILYVLPRTDDLGKQLTEKLQDPQFRQAALPHPATIVAVAEDATAISDEATEMLALDYAVRSGQAVGLDDAARRELGVQLADAKNRLRARLARTFGWDGTRTGSSASWFTRTGGRSEAQSLSQLASSICDGAFTQAPPIHNELINRDQLSSAAARARRELLVRMVENGAEENLGITGHPPELSIYLSVLRKAGLHRQSQDRWIWSAPDTASSFRGIWDAILAYLDAAGRQVGVSDLFSYLSRPPIGARSGPLPGVLTTLLLAEADRVSLFEEGTLVPSLDQPTIERLLSRPASFSLRAFATDRPHAEILEQTCRVLKPDYQGPSTVLAVVKLLLRKYRRLPSYALRASDVSTEARRLRAVIESARDPQALLFEQIPEALGFTRDADIDGGQFSNRLSDVLLELERSYPRLVARILQTISEEFQAEPRKQLSKELSDFPMDGAPPDIRRFIEALSHPGDDSIWAETVAEQVLSSPRTWSDDDFEVFRLRLRRLHESVEALAELHSPGFARRRRIRIAVRTPDATFMLPATVTKKNEMVASVLAQEFASVAARVDATPDQQIAAVAAYLRALQGDGLSDQQRMNAEGQQQAPQGRGR